MQEPWCTYKFLDIGVARAGGSVDLHSACGDFLVTCTGTSPLLLLRVSGREPMRVKWLVNQFLQVTVWFPVGMPDRYTEGVWWQHSIW